MESFDSAIALGGIDECELKGYISGCLGTANV